MVSTSTTPKGGRSPGRAIFSRSNSFSRQTLATTDFKRRFSSFVFDIGFAAFQAALAASQEAIPPLDRSGRNDSILPRRALQFSAVEQLQNDRHFAFGRPATGAGARGRF